MEALTTAHVQAALDELAPGIRVRIFDTSTATSEEAAASIGTSVSRIAKTIVFMVDDHPVAVVTSGNQRVDDRKLAALYNVGRKKVKIAKPEECIAYLGYAPGGVPPFAHRNPTPVLIDDTLSQFEVVYAAAGSPNAIFAIAFDQLVQTTQGRVVDIVQKDTPGE
jgi:Cys-tRNA(Pro) deacylase